MPDIPSTSPEEQEQTQLAASPALQTQVNEQSAPSDDQNENQEVTGATTLFANQEEAGFQLVMFAPDQQPVSPQPVVPPVRSALPPAAPTKTQPRISSLMKGILIAQSCLLVIGALIIIYLNVYEPARISAEATATTGTAFAKSTITSQTIATKYAIRDATVTAEVIVRSTATATAQQNLYKDATKGTPFISSSLTTVDDSLGWEINYFDGAGCYFIRGAYHLLAKQGYFESCFATATNLRDFTYQVEMTLEQGDIGGVFFRASNRSGYVFFLHSDGSYTLNTGDFNPALKQINFTNLLHGSYSAVKPLSEPNLLTVIARSNRIYLYINKEYVAEVTNSTYEAGQIGVYVYTDGEPTDAAFRNLKVWKL